MREGVFSKTRTVQVNRGQNGQPQRQAQLARQAQPAEKVSVLFYYDGAEDYARPVRLLWKDREYELGTVQFWYATHHEGKLVHHYTLSDTASRISFQLALETENLTWRLEQVTSQASTKRPVNYPLGRLVGAIG